MRLLLDECVDWRLLRELAGFDAKSARQAGLTNLRDGTLLRVAQHDFDVLITVDKDLPFQQNISELEIAVVVLRARTTRLSDLRDLVPRLLATLATIRHGEMLVVRWQDADERHRDESPPS
jgi:predicted nuclease of predicted toxin-antitoxin system